MLVVVFAGPLVGARTDHAPKRKPALVATTVAAVGATTLLGIGPVLLSLAVYAVALIAFNLGSVVYDALLPDVSTHRTGDGCRGSVSPSATPARPWRSGPVRSSSTGSATPVCSGSWL